ncbi:MAG: cytochrome-c peroxidase [Deltaproteobacteria bacterium]|nr:cytochrome-c peroxidase [Deltaproteobacteria bacterium]
MRTTLRNIITTAAAVFALQLPAIRTASAEIDPVIKALFPPLPKSADSPHNPGTPEKIALGKRLYSETKLSKAEGLSCNSCHDLKNYGVDNEATSLGHNNQRGTRNSPTVYNAALHIAQFWDGRAKDVEEQALGPMMNPVEMAMATEVEVIQRLSKDPSYIEAFKKAFPGEKEPLNFQNVGKAIGAFERTLLTPSRFDAYLKGDEKALSAEEIRGLKTFHETGCTMCHAGATVGGQMFQKLGLVKPYETKDLGRYEVTKNEAEKYFFKVPSLRNIEKTAPYFHDGNVKTLDEAVRLMAEHQLGRTLTDGQVNDIVTFLKALTGELPQSAL